jgi:flagellar assembly factor FliW
MIDRYIIVGTVSTVPSSKKGETNMLLNTKHFGEITVDENHILTFPEGLLGFESIKKYIFLSNPDPQIPFHWLQAIDDPNLAFVITNPFQFKKDYSFDIPEKVLRQFNIQKPEDILVYTIAVVPEDLQKMTINLRGPLIIHVGQKKGKQLILDGEEYSLKYYLFQPSAEEIGGTQCSY